VVSIGGLLSGGHAVMLAVSINGIIKSYGYGAVFVLVALESLGVPLPGETTLIAAATYAGATHRLSVWVIFVVAAAAAIIGDSMGYWIGDKGGYRLLYRYGHYIRVEETDMKVARYLFDRHGGTVVFFGRFVIVLRSYAAFLAGTSRMRYRRFLAFNASGGTLWAGLYAFVAYYAAGFLTGASKAIEIAFGVAAVAVVVAVVLFVRYRLRALRAKATAAYPGPLEEPDTHHGLRGARDRHDGHPGTDGTGGAASGASASARVGAGHQMPVAHDEPTDGEPATGEDPAEAG
jgi:membrane protein DedA with SNARE-associated domain